MNYTGTGQQAQQQQGPGFWGGAAAGAAGYSAVDYARSVGKKAVIGETVAIGTLGINILGGNQAQGFANSAMANANAMVNNASTGLTAADGVQVRQAIQNLAQGLQAVNPLGYLGVQQSTQPAPLGSTTPATATQNLSGILIIALLIFLLMR